METYGVKSVEIYDASPEELYRQFSEASILPHEQGLATLKLISNELRERNLENIEASLAFISLMESSSSAYDHHSHVWGGIASRFALRVREVDRDAGMQKVHTLLRHQNSSFQHGCWTEVERWSAKGKLPFDDYSMLFGVHVLSQKALNQS